MKKKLVCLFLAMILVCFAACNTGKTQETVTSPGGQTPPSAIVPPEYYATVEYGEPDLITDNTGPLWAYIRFPAASGPTDDIIEEWARGVYKSASDEIAELRKNDPEAEGEVNVQFDSYLVDGRYAGILENGMFMSSHLAHPTSIVRTFNIDTQSGTLLANTDILDYSQIGSVLGVMRDSIMREHSETADQFGEMDETWLEHIAIGHDGIIIALERGKFLPSYLGAVKVTLPYDKLGNALILGAEPAPEAPAEPPKPPVIPGAPPQSGDIDPSKPMIALTFDDGPSKYTSQILDILERYGVRATFCVVGNLVNARKDTIGRASGLGCEIIGHSWDHRDLSKLTAGEIKKQLNDTSAAIESVTGIYPKLYRPPYGAVSSALKNTSAELGYALINWSIDPLDWSNRNADMVYKEIMTNVNNRAIVLSHDLYGSTADAMERVIPELISRGYQLVTVTELMYYSGKTLEAGVVYNSGN